MVGAHQQTGEVRDHQSHPGDAAADRAVAAGVLWKLRWRINLLALEERDARSLGVPVAALRRA
jgi:hypothetical protein